MPNLQPMGIKAVAEGVGKFNSKVDSMNKSITKGNKALDKAEKSGASLASTFGKMAGVVGVATGAFLAIQKAFEFGRRGALITQTGESFDFLLEKIGAAPDLLNQLREASKGTITDLDLMSSTATLLAGAGDKLAVSLADATPRLLEIAKAANKLNPALGSTAFLYQSIATGVKRAQPLILDNLGITIKVGEANEAFAKSIGKTVEELNAEEKAMAILQGTLEAGDNLIAQVGGNTDSATDSFDRATVAITEAGDAIKTKLAPFLADAAEGLATLLTFSDGIISALAEQEQRTLASATSWEEYNAELERIERTGGFVREHFGGIDSELGFLIASFTDADAPTRQFANTLAAVSTEANGVVEANRNIVLSLTELTEAKLAQEALGALNTAFKEGAIDADTYKSEYVEVATGLGNMSSESVIAQLNLFDLKQDLDAGKISTQQFVSELNKLDGKVVDVFINITTTGGIPEFQHGGQFTVGGKPGVDQNLVAFRASRGEVVTVTPTSNVNNSRNVTTGDVHFGGRGQMSEQTFDRMMRSWLGT
jgi:hypothetical protein